MSAAELAAPRPRKTWPQFVAAFMLNDLAGIIRKLGFDNASNALSPEHFGAIMELLYEDHIDRGTARKAVIWQIEKNIETREFIKWALDRMSRRMAV